MSKVTSNYLFLSLFILLASTIGGSLITKKLENGEAALQFIWLGMIVSAVIFCCQAFVFRNARKELFFQLLFLGFSGFTMVWFMLSLFLPIFWISTTGLQPKLTIAAISAIILIFNVMHGFRTLDKAWATVGKKAFEIEFSKSRDIADWDKIVRKMKIVHNVFIPGIPQTWTTFISIIMIGSMILGLNLRSIYPVFSIYAWGLPATVIASYFIQMSGFYFAQAAKVRDIEKKGNVLLKSKV